MVMMNVDNSSLQQTQALSQLSWSDDWPPLDAVLLSSDELDKLL